MMPRDASRRRLVPTGALLRSAGLFALVLLTFLVSACGGGDPCASKTCFFGVCDSETGQCVNEATCSSDEDCIAGYTCGQTGECVPDPCNSVTCERGVCQRGTGECVNAEDCEGDRANCREGYFCNSSDRCQEDLCVTNEIDCGDGGVCVPSTGECDNAEVCQDDSQCLPHMVCVENECLRKHVGCEPECEGDQTCEPDPNKRTGYCSEPRVCETSIDCVDDRACGGIHCVDPVACRDDAFEPNDTMAESTDLFANASDGLIQASVCRQETDLYSVATTDVVSSDFSGQMVTTLTVPKRDIGLGEVALTIQGPEGGRLRTTNFRATPEQRTVSLKTSLSAADHGIYTVEVSPGDDVTKNGLEYWLNARFEKPGATAACNDPWNVRVGQTLYADAVNESETGMGSSCTSEDNPAPEDVYALEVDSPKEVLIRAKPTRGQGDPTISLRGRCRELATEKACRNRGGPGELEVLKTPLDEGTHYIVVQPPAGSSLGPYQLFILEMTPNACRPSRNFCVDQSTAALCDPGGYTVTRVNCEDGCNPTFGTCFDR